MTGALGVCTLSREATRGSDLRGIVERPTETGRPFSVHLTSLDSKTDPPFLEVEEETISGNLPFFFFYFYCRLVCFIFLSSKGKCLFVDM